jgi:hypothetical protein
LLRAGLLGSAAVWAGGQLGCAARRVFPAVVTQRAALSPPGEEIMRAVIPAVLGPLLPIGGAARLQALDTGVAQLDDYLAHLSLPLQEEAHGVFETLDLLPVRVVLVGTWGRWQDAAPETIESFLRSARDSHFDLLRRMFAFLQSMAVLAWFDQQAAWPEIGYSGPPIERPVVSGGHT